MYGVGSKSLWFKALLKRQFYLGKELVTWTHFNKSLLKILLTHRHFFRPRKCWRKRATKTSINNFIHVPQKCKTDVFI